MRGPPPRRDWRVIVRLLLPLLAVALGGCGATQVPIPEPSPEEIPELEAEAEAQPADPAVLVRLGAAYRAADRSAEAVAPLERARELDPEGSVPVLLLGVTYEDLERWAEARALYERYLELAPDAPAADRVRDRLALVERREVEALVRDAVAREQELADAPSPTTLAVFPFRYAGEDEELAPLGHALAGMLTTDLSEAGRFTVLERTHVQALVSELELAEEGLVDRSTAARSGRILGAGRVVQGRFGGTQEQFELDAAVVEVDDEPAVQPVGLEEGLDQFFEMEKALVFALFDAMGVTLTPAERERILDRRTDNLQSLLAYGRGLEASQRGAFGEAADHFNRAAQLDPGFALARTEANDAEQLSAAAESSTSQLVTAAQEVELPALPDPVDLVEAAAVRDPAQEVLGTEGLQSGVVLEIVIRRPGGAQ